MSAGVLRRLLWCVLLLTCASVQAQSMYTGTVPVASQSAQERGEALKSALAQVVVNLTGGDKAVLARPDVAQAIANAANYVQQYQYTQDAYATNGTTPSRWSLVARFDSGAVNKLIADLGLVHGGASASPAAEQAAADVGLRHYRVWIGNLRSADDYARAVGALARIELVRGVRAEQARGDGVELDLDVIGPLPRLLELLATTPLQVLNDKPPIAGVDALLGLRP
jgi:hypothetical protein